MQVFIVTGGIGSGKSEVCRIIRDQYGCGVYDADFRVKRLYDVHPTLLDDIEAALNATLRNENGQFVPSMLSRLIFSDKEALGIVENYVFPALIEDFESWKEDFISDPFVVFESATVLEKPQFEGFGDKVIIVYAPYETRLERACNRDGVSGEAISARMQNQTLMNRISAGEIPARTDAVIINDGTVSQLKERITETMGRLLGNR